MADNKQCSKTTLVTGGCGFVGRNMVRRLLKDGKSVWVIDDLSVGLHCDKWVASDGQRQAYSEQQISYFNGKLVFIKADATDFFRNPQSVTKIPMPEFSDVFHFAAIVGGRAMIDGNPLAVAKDLALDAQFFNWAVEARPERILYASSSAAYPVDLQGSVTSYALKEDFIDFGGRLGQPDMTYGWAKLTGEYLATIAHKHHGLQVACIRPFSGYGEEQDLSYPVPSIALRAARRDNPLVVWGSGLQGRDFVHIEDCVEAALRILDVVSDGSAVNIGSGVLTNFREVAALCARIEGYTPKIQPLEGKPVGVHSRYANIERMESLLGWRPSISLEEGLTRVLATAHERVACGEHA